MSYINTNDPATSKENAVLFGQHLILVKHGMCLVGTSSYLSAGSDAEAILVKRTVKAESVHFCCYHVLHNTLK